jgi:hypothetical protein
MPLASLWNLLWAGPASTAAIVVSAAAASGSAKVLVRGGGAVTASAAVIGGLTTVLFASGGAANGIAAVDGGLTKQFVRAVAAVKVNAVSQSEIESALLDVEFEPGWTARKLFRLQLAHIAGNATGLDGGSIAFRSADGSKTRIAGTISAGTRTMTTRDGD